MTGYELLDSGDLQKWERFGPYILQRPCPQAVWRPEKKIEADAFFSREEGKGWQFRKKLPKSWEVEIEQVRFSVVLTDFGHLGIFPEHMSLWGWLKKQVKPNTSVLNLFAYSGGASIFMAKQGAKVCHLDAAKGMVDWAKENGKLNGVDTIRWIVDDAMKFLKREEKRGVKYDGIILDPPTFGRGTQGEVFKLEKDFYQLLEQCKALSPRYILLTCHTPGMTPLVLSHMLNQIFPKPKELEIEELLLESKGALPIPCGSVAKLVVHGNN